jgi:tetratricopeptide (TPR) repeat protein
MASQTQPSPTAPLIWPAAQLSWLGRQLLLVPEAVLLLVLLCLHARLGPTPALVGLGVGLVGWFLLRVALIYAARQSVNSARYGRAAGLARAALWLYPLSSDVHALLGTVYLGQGRPGAAAVALARAVRYYPLQASLHAALSAALLEDGQPQAALAEAAAALQIDPSYAPAYLHQASAEELLEAPADLVERRLRTGLEQPADPADEAALRCALARVLLRRGNLDAARLALARIERLLPASPAPQRAELHYQLGEILRLSGDPDAARTHFSASESLDPSGPYAAAAWRAARL